MQIKMKERHPRRTCFITGAPWVSSYFFANMIIFYLVFISALFKERRNAMERLAVMTTEIISEIGAA